MLRNRLLVLPRSRTANTAASLAAATLVVALIPAAARPPFRIVLDLLLVATLGGLVIAGYAEVRVAFGTRRAVLTGLAAGALFAALGQTVAILQALPTGARAPFPSVGDLLFLFGHASLMTGILVALRRVRPMRFGAVVDALLLVAAAVLLIVQLDYFPTEDVDLTTLARWFVIVWQVVGAVTLILLSMLLALRGERLGASTAIGITIGTVVLGIGSAWYLRVEMDNVGGSVGPAIALLALAVAGYVLALGRPWGGDLSLTAERPRVESDAATIRAFAIVIAILIAAGSAAALGFTNDPTPGLALTVATFGLLLAVRTAHALWEQRRTTVALENSVVAEREMSATLEHRVSDRTRELAEAQRALQRMWTLAQQIALELDRCHVLERFLEAISDVARADGALVAVQNEAGLTVASASGIAASLQGAKLSPQSALGRVTRSGEPWWTENAHYDGVGGPVPEAVIAPDIRGMATVTLQRRGDAIGAVGIVSRRHRRFTEQEIAHVEAMTELLSLALANAQLVESMRQTEWRFRTLFRAAPDAVLTVLESGRIREANEAVRELTGLELLQIVGRTLDELVAPEDRERVRFEVAETLAGTPARFEARFIHTNGTRIVSLAARRLPQADPPTVLLVGRDMTSEREMRMRLAETERLAAVGELVAGVAHEVNNPLCTISAFAQLMLRDTTLSEAQRDSVEVIQSETVRASQVLRDLLTFARRSEGTRQQVDLRELMQRTVRLRAYELEQERITLELQFAESLPLVQADPGQIQQVLLNLITNAVQAMKPNGGVLRMSTFAEEASVIVEVSDTGPGMPAEVRARIFEPFFTTKKEGTGLGLSVSYGIITAHGGTIGVLRSSEEGTTFRVALPEARAQTMAEDDMSDLVVKEYSPVKGLRLLFVDDEPSLRSGMSAYGRLRRVHVVTAEDGASALAATRIGDFDAVVCDLRMPGMDGATFWETLRLEKPLLAARTVFITGDVVSPGSRAFLDRIRQPVLNKPFDFDQLEQVLLDLMRAEAAA